MARKRKPPETINTMEWMATYSDTVTLLLCFFVLLFSFSTVNEKKWREIVESFSGEYPVSSAAKGSPINPDAKGSPANLTNPEDALYKTIKNYIESNGLASKVEVVKENDSVIIRFKDTILFDPDKTQLREDGKLILGNIGDVLKGSLSLIEMINIEGHTASNPKGQPEFENTFEFSTQRAVNVLSYMITEERIDPLKLSAIGYGQYHPIETNETAEGRMRNRRVEIIVRSRSAKTG